MTESRLHRERRAAIRITLIGSVIDLLLGLIKIFVGLIAGSLALISDGIHSLSDLVTDAFVLVVARMSRDAPDAEHPYGHGRFETLGTVIIGIALGMIAGGILYDSVRRLNSDAPVSSNTLLGVAVAVISIISKEWIYRLTRKVAMEIQSPMLLANAWHSRTDAFSSIVVLVGLAGVLLGYPWMDLLAAMGVALLIAWIAWRLVAGSLRELVDTGLPPEKVAQLERQMHDMPGVRGIHSLRSRQLGGQVFLDVHVQVDSRISVSEGHYLGDHIIRSLKNDHPDITDVIVHIDPEKDEQEPDLTLPLRRQVKETLLERWHGLLSDADIEDITLHYLDQKVHVEVIINLSINKELVDKLNSEVEDINWLERITFYGTV